MLSSQRGTLALKTPCQSLGSLSRMLPVLTLVLIPSAVSLSDAAWRELGSTVDFALLRRPASAARQLRMFLRIIQWLPLLRFGLPFTFLSSARKVWVLRYLEDHRIEVVRTGFWGLRTLIFLAYYSRDEIIGSIGYRPHKRGWEVLA
jgi:hypothetical protein